MLIQINGAEIHSTDAINEHVNKTVTHALHLFERQVTRVEVHLSDENGDKPGENDKRCLMEARLEGRQPIAVTHQAATLDQAVDGAADKLTKMIESALWRRLDQKNRRTDPFQPGPQRQE